MKQSKQPLFWKPDKVSLLKPAPMNVLLDYPKSKSNFNPINTNHKLFGFDTKIYKPKSAFTKSINIFNKGVKAQKNLKVVNTNINLPKKEMNWFQAKSKFPKLNPFKDADRDGVMNMYDCKPFNKSRQGGEIKTKTQIGRSVQKMQEKNDYIKNAQKIKDANISQLSKSFALRTEKKMREIKKVINDPKVQERIIEERAKAIDESHNMQVTKNINWQHAKKSADAPYVFIPGIENVSSKTIRRLEGLKKVDETLDILGGMSGKEYGNIGKTKAELSLPMEQERTKRDKLKLKMKLEAQEKFRKISEKGKTERLIENIGFESKKLDTRKLEAIERAKSSMGESEARIKTAEERRIRYEGMAGPRMVKNISALVNKISETGQRRPYKERFVSGETYLRKGLKRQTFIDKFSEKSAQTPSRIQRTEPYAITKLKEIQSRIPPPTPIKEVRQEQPITPPIKTPTKSGKIIFDMPVKSKMRQFVEKVVRKAPDVYVAERLRRHENVALPTITREDYATKEEKKIGEAERKRIEDESPYEKSTEYEDIYKEKRFAKDLVDELNREAKKTSKKEAKENKAERKRGRKEAKQEKIQERKERREEHKAEKEIKTDDFGTEYKSSAQSIIDEA